MGREGTSQPSCFCSLLLFLLSLTIPPSLCLSSLLYVFFSFPLFIFLLLWQAAPSAPLGSANSNPTAPSLGHSGELQAETSPSAPPPSLHSPPSLDICGGFLCFPTHMPLSGIFLIPRLITNTLSRTFPDADDAFVAAKLSGKA